MKFKIRSIRFCGTTVVALAAAMTTSSAMVQVCPGGNVAIGSECITVEGAAEGIRKIVRDAIDKDGLKAVIVSVSIGDTPVLTEAWGESMTGVSATTDMHFRNGAVAIAYLSTVILRLQEREDCSAWTTPCRNGSRNTRRPIG
jgi:hypothetical protein